MLCEIERDVPVTESLAIIESIYAREGLTAEFDTGMEYSSFPVHKCTVRDSGGRFIALSWGKGELAQARASALFEAWQHIQHRRGQQALPQDGRLHLRKIGEVLQQPELRDEAMLDRLAKDYPECQLGCLQYHPIAGQGNPLWYPAFPRSPEYRWHPATGDKLEYESYLRYSCDPGTAAGISRSEALLHSLLEVIECDSLSFAFLHWYMREPVQINRVDPRSLPAGLRALWAEVKEFIDCDILLLDITTDVGVPAYAALPAAPGRYGSSTGSGASLYPAVAAERSLTELAQAVHHSRLDKGNAIDTTYHGRLAKVKPWPLLERITRLDKEPFHMSGTTWLDFASRAALASEGVDSGEQVAVLSEILQARRLQAYFFPWTPADAACQVVTVLVPGMDSFAIARNTTPVLPTGRAMTYLYELCPELGR